MKPQYILLFASLTHLFSGSIWTVSANEGQENTTLAGAIDRGRHPVGRTSEKPLKIPEPGVDAPDGSWQWSNNGKLKNLRILIRPGQVAEDWDFRGVQIWIGYPDSGVRQCVLDGTAPRGQLRQAVVFDKNSDGSFVEHCDVEGIENGADTTPAIEQNLRSSMKNAVRVEFNHFYWQSSDTVLIRNGSIHGNLFEKASKDPDSDAHMDYIYVNGVPEGKTLEISDNVFRVGDTAFNINNILRITAENAGKAHGKGRVIFERNLTMPYPESFQSVPIHVLQSFTGPVLIRQNDLGLNQGGKVLYSPDPETNILWDQNRNAETGNLIPPPPGTSAFSPE